MSAVIVARSPAIINVNQVPPRCANSRGRGTQTDEVRMHNQSSPGHAHGAEEWRAVVGLEGRYEVSSLGRVRSLWFKNRFTDRPRATPLILRPGRASNGYLLVSVGRGSVRSIHRLVLAAFVGPCPPGHEGAHLNGDRADARLVNLAWKTKTENEHDKIRHGTLSRSRGDRNGSRLSAEQLERGERNTGAKVSAEQVREIRAAALVGEKTAALGARYGLTQSAVQRILSRRTWTALPDQPPVARPTTNEQETTR